MKWHLGSHMFKVFNATTKCTFSNMLEISSLYSSLHIKPCTTWQRFNLLSINVIINEGLTCLNIGIVDDPTSEMVFPHNMIGFLVWHWVSFPYQS